ncbi:MAG: hypothetical protein GY807_00790, partial [Gammaproteobacteria bacterium]|nr:hypothetical protein [Gammaproteobacteria bacterium]
GTIPAQLIGRDYSTTGQIRSVVLDGAVPLEASAMADTPAQVNRSMAQLFEKCEADLVCRAAYPNLETAYRQIINRLQVSPIILSATNPLNGNSFTFPYDIDDFGFTIQYGPYRTFPAFIYDLYDGDYTQIIDAREQFIGEFRHNVAGGGFALRTSINCNEPWHTISPEQRAAMAIYP